MGEFSPIHWLIVLAIIVVLFGRKRIPEIFNGPGPRPPGLQPPTHPVPVTGEVEIRGATDPDKPPEWFLYRLFPK